MVFGVAALIVGIVAIQGFTMDEWPQELKDALENEFITSFSLYVIITGGVCFIFGLFGIASATCAKNVVTLYIYIFLLFLLGVIQVALGVYCITAEDALSDLPLVGADLKTAVDDAIQDSMCTGTFTERQDAQTTFNDAFGCQTVAGAFGVTDASVVVNQDWLKEQFKFYKELKFFNIMSIMFSKTSSIFFPQQYQTRKFFARGMTTCPSSPMAPVPSTQLRALRYGFLITKGIN